MQHPPQGSKVVLAHERRIAQVFYVRTALIIGSENTGGTYSSYEVIADPGYGAKLHIHSREDESMYIIEGQFSVRCGEQEYTLGAGDYISLPKGVPHMFTNTGQTTGRVLSIATPAGIEGFFEGIDDLLSANQGIMARVPREEFIALCDKYGIEFLRNE